MIHSMTAFERREAHGAWDGRPARLAWELRSVNHRYLEIQPRLPDELRPLEPAVRERLAQALGRGKVEATLRLDRDVGEAPALEVDWARVDELGRLCAAVQERLGEQAAPAPVTELLRQPGVLREPQGDTGPLHEAALALLDEAVAGLRETRRREGGHLAEHLRQRAAAARAQVDGLTGRRGQANRRVRESLEARLAELPEPADPGRLEQELAYIAQRLDIDEELERLTAHLDEVQRLLGVAEPVGRRLDFLMQELNREANTIASKAGDPPTSNAAVELKVLIEQMREQVQNVE